MTELGYDSLLIDGHPSDTTKSQFIWRPQAEHFQQQKQIFVEVLKDNKKRSKCHSFNFNPSDEVNSRKTMIDLIDDLNSQSWTKAGQQILLPFDCDFNFSNATLVYQQIDKFIDYFNKHNFDNIVIEYSSLSQYFQALSNQNVTLNNQQTKITWPIS